MNKLQNCIETLSYYRENMILLRNILNCGNCNICSQRTKCKYTPKLGEMVRYNCPFFESIYKTDDGIRICDIKENIDAMSPLELWINDELIWKDGDDIDDFYNILERMDFIQKVDFKIIESHHSIVRIILR